jgi:hypothetical protein
MYFIPALEKILHFELVFLALMLGPNVAPVNSGK